MLNLVDIDKSLHGVLIKKRRHFIIFTISTILSIFLIILLMLTSNQNYILELVFSIIIADAYLIYLIFFFSIIQRCLNAELRFYNGVKKTELSEVDCKLKSISNEMKEYNGLDYYVLLADVDESLKNEEKNFYLPRKFEFKKGQNATLYVFGSIVIKAELKK